MPTPLLQHSRIAAWAPFLSALAGCAPSGAVDDDGGAGQSRDAIVGDCTIALGATPEPRQPELDAPVTITATGICVDGSAPELRTSVITPSNRTLLACDYQTDPSCEFSATAQSGGTYTFKVEARRAGDPVVAAVKTLRYAIGGACTELALTADPASAAPGERVTLHAGAVCDPGVTPQFAFSVLKPGGGASSLGSWQTAPEAVWDTTNVAAGTASLRVYVAPLGNKAWDVLATRPFALGDTCVAGTLKITARGSLRSVTATAICTGDATPLYSFAAIAPDGSERPLRDFAPEPSLTWDVAGLDGTHKVRVNVRAAENPGQAPSKRELVVQLFDACRKAALSPIPGTVALGETLTLAAEADCGEAEFAFQIKASTATAWTSVCPYSELPSCAWPVPAETTPGSYSARALVRKAGSIAAYEAVSPAQPFELQDGAVSALRLQDLVPDRAVSGSPLLSGDGTTVVIPTVAIGGSRLFLWSEARGLTPLPEGILVHDISFDGRALAGAIDVIGAQLALRWTRERGLDVLGALRSVSPFAQAIAISRDGERVLGESATLDGNAVFDWRSGAPELGTLLPRIPGSGRLFAASVDTDTLLLGASDFLGWMRWTPESGIQNLESPEGAISYSAVALSADGRFVVGGAVTETTGTAVRWGTDGKPLDLMRFPAIVEGRASAFATSGDGSQVYGTWANRAFVWDERRGMRLLVDAFPRLLAAIRPGELPVFVNRVSTDGRVLLVTARDPVLRTTSHYLVTLP